MLPKYISVHRRIDAGFFNLASKKRKDVLTRLARLRRLPVDRWAEEGARLYDPSDETYLLEASPELFVLFTVSPDRHFVIQDAFHPGWLEVFRSTANGQGDRK